MTNGKFRGRYVMRAGVDNHRCERLMRAGTERTEDVRLFVFQNKTVKHNIHRLVGTRGQHVFLPVFYKDDREWQRK